VIIFIGGCIVLLFHEMMDHHIIIVIHRIESNNRVVNKLNATESNKNLEMNLPRQTAEHLVCKPCVRGCRKSRGATKGTGTAGVGIKWGTTTTIEVEIWRGMGELEMGKCDIGGWTGSLASGTHVSVSNVEAAPLSDIP
jgi:hypothetical protein